MVALVLSAFGVVVWISGRFGRAGWTEGAVLVACVFSGFDWLSIVVSRGWTW